MTEQARNIFEEYIGTRLAISWQRLQKSPTYQMRRHKRDQSSTILCRLNPRERFLVDEYVGEELALAYLESIEAYLQGLQDCVPLLAFLNLIRPESAL